MLSTRSLYLLTALLLGLASIDPSSADSQGKGVPQPAAAQDYWAASRSSLQLANELNRHHETLAACASLAKSLEYYRLALAKETDTPISQLGKDLGDDEGMREIRARFGCPGAIHLTVSPDLQAG